jgi:hypothetical protein
MIGFRRELYTRVTNIRAERSGPTSRVVADVNGVPLWFESDDTELSASPEVFGSALLLVSLHHGRTLVIDAPVSDSWLDNISRLMPVWRQWWGYKSLMPQVGSRDDSDADAGRSPRKALLFSSGVDSFYSVLTGGRHDLLVSVHGFDFPLRDTVRMAGLRKSLAAVASSFDAEPLVIRTNFREHPVAGRGRLWERAHGGVLAAIGHVLSNRAGQLTVSSSYGLFNPRPWGSSFMTDSYFSSDKMRIEQCGIERRREQKIPLIAHHPLVRQHLRVCWENRSPSGNCSRCGKCLMTMLSLAEEGVLDEFEVFDGQEALINRLNAMPFLWKHTNPMDRAARRGRLDPRLARAARRLVKRSQRARRLRELATRFTYLLDRYA